MGFSAVTKLFEETRMTSLDKSREKPPCQGFISWDWIANSRTQYFEKYLNFIESYGDKQIKFLEKQYKKINAGKSAVREEYIDYMLDNLNEQAYEDHETRQLMYKSFTVSIFIFIEQNLNDFCNHLKSHHGQNFSYQDMTGDGIGKTLRYIKIVLKSDFPLDKKTKFSLNAVRAIRNIIVHNDSVPTPDELKHIKKILVEYPKLLSDNAREIILSREYSHSLITLNATLEQQLSESCHLKKK